MEPRSTARIVPGANRSVRATLISLVLPSVTTANHGRYPSWSSSRCSLMAPLVRRNFAQSNMLTDRSMTLPSRLISLFLKRNFCRPPWLCTSSWHWHSVCSNTVWYNSYANEHRPWELYQTVFPALAQRLLEHRLVQLPRPMLIGVGQGGSLGCHRHPQMLQLPLATRQAVANLAQRMRLSQLAKQHGHELAPTGETPRVPFSLVLLDRLFEIPAREQLQHLRENAAYFVHRLSLLRLNWFFPNPIQRIRGSTSHRQRRPPLRPAGSPLIWTAVGQNRQFEARRLFRCPSLLGRCNEPAIGRHRTDCFGSSFRDRKVFAGEQTSRQRLEARQFLGGGPTIPGAPAIRRADRDLLGFERLSSWNLIPVQI